LATDPQRGQSTQLDASIMPHGGELKTLVLPTPQRSEMCEKASRLSQLVLTSRECADLAMLGCGAFSPLTGFMTRDDYQSVVESMRLSSGVLWPLPVCLAVSEAQARSMKVGEDVALVGPNAKDIMGMLCVKDIYPYDPRKEASCVYSTNDEAHPGVAALQSQKAMYVGGTVTTFSERGDFARFPEFSVPKETRDEFASRGWKTIVAFQTRNPMHRSHEYLTKVALEICDGLLVHPTVGQLKKGDLPADLRLQCYRALIDNYYPRDRVLLSVYPLEMRYAGPREALLHAIIRQNFGCTHIIIGRDHAGVGSYYDPFAAHAIFDELEQDDLRIKPLKMDWTFWCRKCGGVASFKTCPHSKEDRLLISGTALRQMLSEGERPPEPYSRPEVLDILMDFYRDRTSG